MTTLQFRLSRLFAGALVVAVLTPAVLAQADAPMPNPPEFPAENPMLTDQDILGKFLFWDEQLSHDNTMACGTCHIHESGGSDPRSTTTLNPGFDMLFGTADDVHGSAGVIPQDITNVMTFDPLFGTGVQVTGRKSPTMINAVYFNELFWDGRATDAYTDPQSGLVEIAYLGALESQAAGPPVSSVEMAAANRTWDDVTDKLATVTPMALGTNLPLEMADFLTTNPTYPDMFNAVYGDSAITSKRVMFAIGNYERTLISDETALDDFLKGINPDLGPFEPGFQLFQGSANCAACHVLPFTMDNDFHNIGVRPDAEDAGRMNVTSLAADEAKFKTPNIRNAALRLPLFHNGSANSITEVIDFYETGGDFPGPNLDVNMLVLTLTAQDKLDLVDFVENGLTDARVENAIFPFTRPTLRSELPSLNTVYGVASLDSIGGTASILTNGPANRGNDNFLIGLSDARPSKPASLVFSFFSDPAGTPYPDPRFPVPVNLGLGGLFMKVPTTTTVDGIASFNMPIPPDAILAGFKFYAQWFIEDAGAVPPGDIYGTEGIEIEIL